MVVTRPIWWARAPQVPGAPSCCHLRGPTASQQSTWSEEDRGTMLRADRWCTLGALAEADEAFLSSSTRGVQPIGRVDGSPLGAAPGPLSAAAADSFAALVAR